MGRGHSGTYVLTRICTLLGLTLGTRSELLAGDAADRIFTEQIKKIARNEYVDQHLDRSKPAQHREHTDWKVAEVVERILPTLERYRYVAIDPPPPERQVTSLNLKEKRVEYS